ncbi:enoyl-CoA hydratase-related protein [Kribbella shirazensis]|uniref:Enoyl-CoA hydratase n=1 Tax=Kribbella shirazensis TaxID=1105143 RepID=A0A7X6A4W7_9ACTN|nr:enoyl-CoA hydratase [Kribbella shirazensis]
MTDVSYEVVDNVARMTLRAPERRNALTPQMAAEIVAAIDRADADESVGAILITGGASFCAGADRGLLADTEADPAGDRSYRTISGIYNSFLRLGTTKSPTVAAVRGAAVGAGLNLAMATDLRIVSRDARLLSGFARIGLHPGGGHFGLLARSAGREAAAAIGLFGCQISGSRACELGMAWQAVDDADVEQVALDLARQAAADPALSREMVASFRRQCELPGASWDAGVQIERSPQMWSFRRRADLM